MPADEGRRILMADAVPHRLAYLAIAPVVVLLILDFGGYVGWKELSINNANVRKH